MRQFLLGGLGLVCVVLVTAVSGFGQDQLGAQAQLGPAFAKAKGQLLQKMLGIKPLDPNDKNDIETMAQWYTWRFTWRAVAESPELANQFAKFLKEFDQEFLAQVLGPNVAKGGNRAFIDQIGPAFVRSIKPVFQDDILAGDNRMVQVWEANMLPRIARLKQDDFSAYLVELVKDPSKHDAIRVFALQGLKEALPVRYFDDVDINAAKWEKQRDREIPYVDALAGVVEGTLGPKTGTAQADVIRYIRKQALESLAQVGTPAVKASKREGRPLGAAAPAMLLTLSKKGLDPEPGIHEKIEAAIGLCQMKYVFPQDVPPRAVNEYRPELAVYLVGRFLEEFAKEHDTQWAFLKPGPNHRPPTVLWKVQSKRLEYALKDLVKNAAVSPLQTTAAEQKVVEANAKKLEALAQPFLADIYNGNQAQVRIQYRNEITKMKPQAKAAFRGLKTTEIDLE